MFQRPFFLLPEAVGQASGSAAFAAGPSLRTPAAEGGEATPTGPPLPPQSRHKASSTRPSRSAGAAARCAPFLTVLAGAAQWLYYPARRPEC
jgi:hypothetical protein